MGCPLVQPKAFPNSSKFCTEPLTRHLPGECGSTSTSWRADLVGLVLAPHLGEADEVALRLGVAVDLVVDGFALRRQRVQQRHVGDAQAAVVGGVFAQGELAVQLECRGVALGRGRFKAAVLVGDAIGPLLKCFAIVRGLPLAQIALAVELGALVVEAVGHFVADDHADAAEVHCRIDLEVEERRLQNARPGS